MRKLLLFLFILILPFSANAATCNAGYYLNNGQCADCLYNHYCPGDDMAYSCPPITYTQSDLQQMVRDAGYNVISDGVAELWSTWGTSQDNMKNIEQCLMTIRLMNLEQGWVYVLGAYYSIANSNYVIQPGSHVYWYLANPGYYLSGTNDNEVWIDVKACTNSHPANSHYSGPGTPDSADGTIVDANDCPWVCDEGYYNNNGTCTLCEVGYYCTGGVKSACTGGTYSNTNGATSCTSCPAPAGELASRATGEYDYWTSHGIHSSLYGCIALFYDDDPYGTYITHCYYDGGNTNYGGVANSICQTWVPFSCEAGYYNTITSLPEWDGGTYARCDGVGVDCVKGRVCTSVGVGYYSPAGDLNRYECTNKPANATYTSSGVNNDCAWECDAGYYKNGNTCSKCTGTTFSYAGASSCTACPAVTGELASRVVGYGGWWPGDVHNTITGCIALFADDDPNATYQVICYYNYSAGNYAASGQLCQTIAPTECAAGYYSTIENTPEWQVNASDEWYAWCYTGVDCMKGRVCTDVGTGYYSPVGDLNRYACTNKPANSSYSASGTSSSCPWTCDTNYWEYSNACHARCPYGDGELHVGQYTHPLWADIDNVPSPSVYIGELGPNHDGLCYAYLEPDDTPVDNHHGFHTVHNGVPYHAINLGLYGLE